MRSLKFALIVALAIFIASPLTPTIAQPPEDVEVPRLQNPSNIDGVLEPGEWIDGVELSLNVIFDDDWQWPLIAERSGSLFFKHDCENLWICFVIDDPTEDTTVWADYPDGTPSIWGDWFSIFYDASGDNVVPGAGDDEKYILHPDFVDDGAFISDVAYGRDVTLGGTIDANGASGYDTDNDRLVYELVHPLNSGDSDGNDLAIEPGGNIVAMFLAGDATLEETEYGYVGMYNLIITPCPVGEIGNRIFKATENSVYFVPTGNIYDDSAFYAFYAYKENPQIITPPTQSPASSAYLDGDGKPLFTGDIVTLGGRFANRMVAYYEDAGIALVGYEWDGTSHLFTRISDGSTLFAIEGSTYDADEKDYFVFQTYNDGDRYVFSEWGICAEGTYAGGACFIDIIYPNLQDYTNHYYIYSWTDLNNDNMPQSNEIALETSGS